MRSSLLPLLATTLGLALLSAAPVTPAQDASAPPEKAASPWTAYLDPGHGQLLKVAEQQVREITLPHLNSSDAETATAAREVIRLLDLPRKKGPSAGLIGKWQVRSLQSSDLGVYAYPFFPCEIRREGTRGLVLNKHSGSQRRTGVLLSQDNGDLVFLGGSYYEGEEPRGYSAFRGGQTADPEGEDRDSVGVLHQLENGRLLLIFASLKGRGEIYELKRR